MSSSIDDSGSIRTMLEDIASALIRLGNIMTRTSHCLINETAVKRRKRPAGGFLEFYWSRKGRVVGYQDEFAGSKFSEILFKSAAHGRGGKTRSDYIIEVIGS